MREATNRLNDLIGAAPRRLARRARARSTGSLAADLGSMTIQAIIGIIIGALVVTTFVAFTVKSLIWGSHDSAAAAAETAGLSYIERVKSDVTASQYVVHAYPGDLVLFTTTYTDPTGTAPAAGQVSGVQSTGKKGDGKNAAYVFTRWTVQTTPVHKGSVPGQPNATTASSIVRQQLVTTTPPTGYTRPNTVASGTDANGNRIVAAFDRNVSLASAYNASMWSSAGVVTKTVATNVANPSSFTFFDFNSAGNALPGGAALQVGLLEAIDVIGIHYKGYVTVGGNDHTQPISLTGSATLGAKGAGGTGVPIFHPPVANNSLWDTFSTKDPDGSGYDQSGFTGLGTTEDPTHTTWEYPDGLTGTTTADGWSRDDKPTAPSTSTPDVGTDDPLGGGYAKAGAWGQNTSATGTQPTAVVNANTPTAEIVAAPASDPVSGEAVYARYTDPKNWLRATLSSDKITVDPPKAPVYNWVKYTPRTVTVTTNDTRTYYEYAYTSYKAALAIVHGVDEYRQSDGVCYVWNNYPIPSWASRTSNQNVKVYVGIDYYAKGRAAGCGGDHSTAGYGKIAWPTAENPSDPSNTALNVDGTNGHDGAAHFLRAYVNGITLSKDQVDAAWNDQESNAGFIGINDPDATFNDQFGYPPACSADSGADDWRNARGLDGTDNAFKWKQDWTGTISHDFAASSCRDMNNAKGGGAYYIQQGGTAYFWTTQAPTGSASWYKASGKQTASTISTAYAPAGATAGTASLVGTSTLTNCETFNTTMWSLACGGNGASHPINSTYTVYDPDYQTSADVTAMTNAGYTNLGPTGGTVLCSVLQAASDCPPGAGVYANEYKVVLDSDVNGTITTLGTYPVGANGKFSGTPAPGDLGKVPLDFGVEAVDSPLGCSASVGSTPCQTTTITPIANGIALDTKTYPYTDGNSHGGATMFGIGYANAAGQADKITGSGIDSVCVTAPDSHDETHCPDSYSPPTTVTNTPVSVDGTTPDSDTTWKLAIAGGTGSTAAAVAGPAKSSPMIPAAVAAASDGTRYVADAAHHEVYKIASDGTLSVLAGTGTAGAATAGPATASKLNNPVSVAADDSGNVYIADKSNLQVYKVTSDGTLSVFAGTGTTGAPTAGAAASSKVGAVAGVATDASGSVYVVDPTNNDVYKVTSGGTLSLFATGQSALAGAVTSDGSGGLYVATGTSSGGAVLHLSSGATATSGVSKVAGDGVLDQVGVSGSAVMVSLNAVGLAVGADGMLYIADSHGYLDQVDLTSGSLSIVAGKGTLNGAPVEGDALSSPMAPSGLAFDADKGKIVLADATNDYLDALTSVTTTDS